MRHLVIGAGEVGTALASLLRAVGEVGIRDLDGGDDPDHADVLHVCFPYAGAFGSAVAGYRDRYGPELVVVHSTVPVGTCRDIGAIHSPVRGRHPNLLEGLQTFTKFFGGERAEAAAAPFESAGVPIWCVPDPEITEAGKLWDLVQYGWSIVVEKAVHRYCSERGLSFDDVYRAFNVTYNDGWQALGEARFTRPVLEHEPGPIGGHCVLQASGFLDDNLADLMIEIGSYLE